MKAILIRVAVGLLLCAINAKGEDVGIWFNDFGAVGAVVAAYQVEDEIRLSHSTSFKAMAPPENRAMVVRNVSFPSLFVTGTYSISWGRAAYDSGEKLFDYQTGQKLMDYDFSRGDGWLNLEEFGWLYIPHYPWIYSIEKSAWQYFVPTELFMNTNCYYIWTTGEGWSWKIKSGIR